MVASEERSLDSRLAVADKQIKTWVGASVAELQQVSQFVGEPSTASAEPSRGISRIGDPVRQLYQVMQHNAAGVDARKGPTGAG